MYVSWITKTIVILCMMWLLAFSLLGGGQWGKDLSASWAKKSCFSDKAGVPIIMLTIPILIASSIASIVATSTTSANFNRYQPSRVESRNEITRLSIIDFTSIDNLSPMLCVCRFMHESQIKRRYVYRQGIDEVGQHLWNVSGDPIFMITNTRFTSRSDRKTIHMGFDKNC